MDILKNPKLYHKKDMTIIVEKGNFLYKDNAAKADFDRLMRGELDYDTHWGKEGFPYHKAFELQDCKNMTLDFSGSHLTMEGLIQTFTIAQCENITIRNLTIECSRAPFSVGKIISYEHNIITVEIPLADFPLQGGEPIWAIMDFSPAENKIGTLWKFRNMTPLEQIAPGIFRFTGEFHFPVLVGNELILRHIGNYRPCFHLLESKNIRLENITIYNHPGMGIVGHNSENIFMDRLQVKPKKNYRMSTTTDATHFISCRGIVSVTHSYFEGMGDDAINVHSFYLAIQEKVDDYTVTVVNLNENGTQDMVFDTPAPLELVSFCKKFDLVPFYEDIVESVTVHVAQWCATLRFKNKLPEDVLDCVFTKKHPHAHLIFQHNHVYNIRARGVLFQTQSGVIEHNVLEQCTGTGIHVNIAPDWWESIGCAQLQIQHNQINHCGFGDGTYENTCGIVIGTEATIPSRHIHKNIQISKNHIKGSGKENGIFISSASHVTVTENTFEDCLNEVAVFECCNVSVYDNLVYR